jgi:hypothetical protein
MCKHTDKDVISLGKHHDKIYCDIADYKGKQHKAGNEALGYVYICNYCHFIVCVCCLETYSNESTAISEIVETANFSQNNHENND